MHKGKKPATSYRKTKKNAKQKQKKTGKREDGGRKNKMNKKREKRRGSYTKGKKQCRCKR